MRSTSGWLSSRGLRDILIQEFQNIKPKTEYVVNNVYLVVSSDAALTWFDFFIYAKALLPGLLGGLRPVMMGCCRLIMAGVCRDRRRAP
jgi:hypothetical protein